MQSIPIGLGNLIACKFKLFLFVCVSMQVFGRSWFCLLVIFGM